MTTKPTGDTPMDLSAREGDDLTAIKGIGLATQRWLGESLGVRTFQDLAALSADDIESRLKAEGRITSRAEIEQWIARAQELAAAELPSQRLAESTHVEPGGEARSPTDEGEWKPFASFVVEFQARQVEGRPEEQRTTVGHMEADTSETWPGIEGERLCQWMLDQVGEKVRPEPEEEPPVEARPAAVPAVTVEITKIQAFQPPQAATPVGIGLTSRPFSGFVRGGEPFALQASFALTGPTAGEVAKEHVAYRARFYAGNLSTGERTHLGDTEPDTLVEGELSCTAMLPDVTLPAGLYRLLVLATVETMAPSIGYLEVPMLQVV